MDPSLLLHILVLRELHHDRDNSLRIADVRQGIQAGFDLQGIHGNFWIYPIRFSKPL